MGYAVRRPIRLDRVRATAGAGARIRCVSFTRAKTAQVSEIPRRSLQQIDLTGRGAALSAHLAERM
jgi:hypothetical protein